MITSSRCEKMLLMKYSHCCLLKRNIIGTFPRLSSHANTWQIYKLWCFCYVTCINCVALFSDNNCILRMFCHRKITIVQFKWQRIWINVIIETMEMIKVFFLQGLVAALTRAYQLSNLITSHCENKFQAYGLNWHSVNAN